MSEDFNRPEKLEKLTKMIHQKTTISLLVEINIRGEFSGFFEPEFYIQLWKDSKEVYTIVYCEYMLISDEKITTFDIAKSDGRLIEKLLLVGPFNKKPSDVFLMLGGCWVTVKPYICNDDNYVYSWLFDSEKLPELKTVADILVKYIDHEWLKKHYSVRPFLLEDGTIVGLNSSDDPELFNKINMIFEETYKHYDKE